MHSLSDVGHEADVVRSEIEELFVRGLAASSSKGQKKLLALAEEWQRIGADHVSSRLLSALRKANAGAMDAPRELLSAYTSLHVFERVLSLEAAAEHWSQHLARLAHDDDEGEEDSEDQEAAPPKIDAKPPAKEPAIPAPIEDPKGAMALASELARAVEDLVRTGLTSATSSTRDKLDASFKEASRRKLLRLGASLRYVNDEVARFLADNGTFSMRRFALFLHRSWLIAKGLEKGLRDKDDRLLSRILLSGASAPMPVPSLEVVTLGVLKRTVENACTFDMKLAVVASKVPGLVGKRLTLSFVFARKAGVPAEAFLELPQPQKYPPRVFREGKTVTVTNAAVQLDDRGSGRLLLGPPSTVAVGAPFTEWSPWFTPSEAAAESALERVKNHAVGPLDLAVEMQEEVVLEGAQMSDEPVRTTDGRRIYDVTTGDGRRFEMLIPVGKDEDELILRLKEGLARSPKPLLYGLCYYEYGKTVLLPLTLYSESPATLAPAPPKGKAKKPAALPKTGGPDLVTLSDKKFDVKALVGTLHL